MEWDEKRLCKGPRPGQPQHMAVQTSGRVASDNVRRLVPASNLGPVMMAAIRANEIKFDHYLAPALGPGILNMWHVVAWGQQTLSNI